MFDDIVVSWERWVASPRGQRRRAAWAVTDPALARWSDQELARPISSARTDAMQAALVARAQDGDEEAARTLVVQLRPGLTGLVFRVRARRRAGGAGGGTPVPVAEVEGEVLSAFGETLARHRLDRRPERIAANLLLDTHQRLWRADRPRSRPPVAGSREPGARETDPGTAVAGALDLVSAVATALDQLTGTDDSRRLTAELAWRAWILDEPSVLIARQLGLERKTVDVRLCRLRAAVARVSGYERVSRSEGSAPPSSPVGPSCVSRQ